jgi:hypothetical protein
LDGGVLLEKVDGLGFAVFKHLEVLLVESENWLILAFGHDDIDDHGAGIGQVSRNRRLAFRSGRGGLGR